MTITDEIVHDTSSERHKLNEYPIEVEFRNVNPDGSFVAGEDWAPLDPANVTTDAAEGKTSFTTTVKNIPTDKRVQYRVLYWTKIDGKTFDGDVYKNKATVNKKTVEADFTWTAIGGGTGSGKEYTRFSIAKSVEGSGADKVPADTKYTVKYTADGEEDTLTFAAGEENRLNSKRYKIGTEFTITEVNLPEIEGIEWGDYEITGNGVSKNDDGGYTVTPKTHEPVKLNLVNKAELQKGNLSVAKSVSGEGAGLLPEDTEYKIGYSYTLNGEEITGTLTVKNGEAVRLPEDVPAGTKVTLTEKKPADVEVNDSKKVSYGEPRFTAGAESGTEVTVTIEGRKTVEVELDNPTTVTEEPTPIPTPEPTPDPTPEPTPEPTSEPTPVPEKPVESANPSQPTDQTPALPSTGAQNMGPIVGAALLLTTIGTAALIITRKRLSS